jgi:(p)ppGpp synthase/HD superfamily hydrolase
MKYTPKIRKAVRFSIKVHELDQKQKRKGKDIAYITHPMTVALILATAGAKENVIVAGLLHDAIEDCVADCPVTTTDIIKEFGEEVAKLVDSITEQKPNLPWAERKKQTLKLIKEEFSENSILLKSADVLSNGTEIIDDYEEIGDEVFERFNAPKKEKLKSQIKLIKALTTQWKDSPLASDLEELKSSFKNIN